MDIFEIKNKVVIITGGYGVLGSTIAQHLSSCGAKLVILGRNLEKAESFAKSLSNDNAIGLEGDVLDKENLMSVKDSVLNKWKKIDVLINAAGGNMPGATLSPSDSLFNISLEDFKKVSDLNLMGTVIPSIVFGEQMSIQGYGSIINVSSVAVDRVLTRVVGYSASKAAMENFTRWMAVDMALRYGDNLRVNAIAPGFFIADQNRKLLTNQDGSLTERGQTIINNTPMKRFGDSSELNGAVQLLASEASKFMTGTVLHIDGGFSAFSGV